MKEQRNKKLTRLKSRPTNLTGKQSCGPRGCYFNSLVNIKGWCKNDFAVINQIRINTENSNHRYDIILLINGLPVVQVE